MQAAALRGARSAPAARSRAALASATAPGASTAPAQQTGSVPSRSSTNWTAVANKPSGQGHNHWGYRKATEHGVAFPQPPRTWVPPGATAQVLAADASLATQHRFGARVLEFNNADSLNELDEGFVKALQARLESYRDNDAVEVIVLKSAAGSVFSSGLDYKHIHSLFKSGDEGKEKVAAFMQAMYELVHTINTFDKPVIVAANGVAMGAGASLAVASKHSYASDSTALAFPETGLGLVPSGGASYALSRMPNGAGMYLALTGGHLSGPAAYWAGALTHLTSDSVLAGDVAHDVGHVFAEPLKHARMEEDARYLRVQREVREDFDRLKASLITTRRPEDANEDDLERFYELNVWYRLHASGNKRMADAFLKEGFEAIGLPDNDVSRGRFLDFGSPPSVLGRDTPAASHHLEDAARRDLAVAALGAKASATLTAESAPSAETVAQLAAVKRVFGAGAGDPLYASAEGTQEGAERSRLDILASIADARLPGDWEAALPSSLDTLVTDELAEVGSNPGAVGAEPAALARAVRDGVPLAWPLGMLPAPVLDALARSSGAGDTAAAHTAIARAVARATAATHGIPVDPLLLPAYEAGPAGLADWRGQETVEGTIPGLTLPQQLTQDMDDIPDRAWELGTPASPSYHHPLEVDVAGLRGVTADVGDAATAPAWWPAAAVAPVAKPASARMGLDFASDGPIADPDRSAAWRVWLRKRVAANKRSKAPHISFSAAFHAEDAAAAEVTGEDAAATLDAATVMATPAGGRQWAADFAPPGAEGEVQAAEAPAPRQALPSMAALVGSDATPAREAADVHVTPLAANALLPDEAGAMAGQLRLEEAEDGSVRLVAPSETGGGGNVYRRVDGAWQRVGDLEGTLDAILLKWQAHARPFADTTILGGKREAALRQFGKAEVAYLGAQLAAGAAPDAIPVQHAPLVAPALSPAEEGALDALLQSVKEAGDLATLVDYGVTGAALDVAKAANPDLASGSADALQAWVAGIRSAPTSTLEANAWAALAHRAMHVAAEGSPLPKASPTDPAGDAKAAAALASTPSAGDGGDAAAALAAATPAGAPTSINTAALTSPYYAHDSTSGEELGDMAPSANALAAAVLDEVVQEVRGGASRLPAPTAPGADADVTVPSLAANAAALSAYRSANAALAGQELAPDMAASIDLAAYGGRGPSEVSDPTPALFDSAAGQHTAVGQYTRTVMARAAALFEGGGDAMAAAAATPLPGDLAAGLRKLAAGKMEAPRPAPSLAQGGTPLAPTPWRADAPAAALAEGLQPFAALWLLQALDAGTLGLNLAALGAEPLAKAGTPLGDALAAPAAVTQAALAAGDALATANSPSDWPRDTAAAGMRQVEGLPLPAGSTPASVSAGFAQGAGGEGEEAVPAAVTEDYAYARLPGRLSSIATPEDARAYYLAAAEVAAASGDVETAAAAAATVGGGAGQGAGHLPAGPDADAAREFAAAAAQQAAAAAAVPEFLARELLTSSGAAAPSSPLLSRLAQAAGVAHPTGEPVPTSAEEVAALAHVMASMAGDAASLAEAAGPLGLAAPGARPGEVLNSLAALARDIQDTRIVAVAAARGGAVPPALAGRQPPTPLQYAEALGLTDLIATRFSLTDAAGNQRLVPLISESTAWAPTVEQAFGAGPTGLDAGSHTNHGPHDVQAATPGVADEVFTGHFAGMDGAVWEDVRDIHAAPDDMAAGLVQGSTSGTLTDAHQMLDEGEAAEALARATLLPESADPGMEEVVEHLAAAAVPSAKGVTPAAAAANLGAAWGNPAVAKARYEAELAAEADRVSRRAGLSAAASAPSPAAASEEEAGVSLGEVEAQVGAEALPYLADSPGRASAQGAVTAQHAFMGSVSRDAALTRAAHQRMQGGGAVAGMDVADLDDGGLQGGPTSGAPSALGPAADALAAAQDAPASSWDAAYGLFGEASQDASAEAVLAGAAKRYTLSTGNANVLMDVLLESAGIQRGQAGTSLAGRFGTDAADAADAGLAGSVEDEALAQVTHDPEYLLKALGLPRTPMTLDTAGAATQHFAAADAARFAVMHPRSVGTIVARLEADGSAWAQATLQRLRACSPTAVVLTHHLLVQAARVDFNTAAAMEARAAAYMLGHPDSEAGLAAAASGAAPTWTPATIEEVDEAALAAVLLPGSSAVELKPRPAGDAPLQALRSAAVDKWLGQWTEHLESGFGASQLGHLFAGRFKWNYELGEHTDYAPTPPVLPKELAFETPEEAAHARQDLHEYDVKGVSAREFEEGPVDRSRRWREDRAPAAGATAGADSAAPVATPFNIRVSASGLPEQDSLAVPQPAPAVPAFNGKTLPEIVQAVLAAADPAAAAQAALKFVAEASPAVAPTGAVPTAGTGELVVHAASDALTYKVSEAAGQMAGTAGWAPPYTARLDALYVPGQGGEPLTDAARAAAAVAGKHDGGEEASPDALLQEATALLQALAAGEEGAGAGAEGVPTPEDLVAGAPSAPGIMTRETLAMHADLHAAAVAAGVAPEDLSQYDTWMEGKQRRLAGILAKDAKGLALSRAEAEELLKADTFGLVALDMPRKAAAGASVGKAAPAEQNDR